MLNVRHAIFARMLAGLALSASLAAEKLPANGEIMDMNFDGRSDYRVPQRESDGITFYDVFLQKDDGSYEKSVLLSGLAEPLPFPDKNMVRSLNSDPALAEIYEVSEFIWENGVPRLARLEKVEFEQLGNQPFYIEVDLGLRGLRPEVSLQIITFDGAMARRRDYQKAHDKRLAALQKAAGS